MYTAVVVGAAVPKCPACEARPVYGQVLSRLAGHAFNQAEYLSALHAMEAVMPAYSGAGNSSTARPTACPVSHRNSPGRFCTQCGEPL